MYDWVRDIRQELEVWRLFIRRPRRPTWTLGAFLLQRYAAIYAAWTAFAFLYGGRGIDCQFLVSSVYGAQVPFAGSVAFIFAQRTLALYCFPRWLALLLYPGVLALTACFAVVASQFRARELPVSLNGAWCGIDSDAGQLALLGFAVSLAFDLVIVVLTMIRLYQLHLRSELGNAIRNSSLVYFCAVFSVNLAVLLVIAISADPTVHATPLGLSFAVTTILLNRMIFGLRKHRRSEIDSAIRRPLVGPDGDLLGFVGGSGRGAAQNITHDTEAGTSFGEKRGSAGDGIGAAPAYSDRKTRPIIERGDTLGVFRAQSIRPKEEQTISISLPPSPMTVRDPGMGMPPPTPSSFVGFERHGKGNHGFGGDGIPRTPMSWDVRRSSAPDRNLSSDANTLVNEGWLASWFHTPHLPRHGRKLSHVKSKDGADLYAPTSGEQAIPLSQRHGEERQRHLRASPSLQFAIPHLHLPKMTHPYAARRVNTDSSLGQPSGDQQQQQQRSLTRSIPVTVEVEQTLSDAQPGERAQRQAQETCQADVARFQRGTTISAQMPSAQWQHAEQNDQPRTSEAQPFHHYVPSSDTFGRDEHSPRSATFTSVPIGRDGRALARSHSLDGIAQVPQSETTAGSGTGGLPPSTKGEYGMVLHSSTQPGAYRSFFRRASANVEQRQPPLQEYHETTDEMSGPRSGADGSASADVAGRLAIPAGDVYLNMDPDELAGDCHYDPPGSDFPAEEIEALEMQARGMPGPPPEDDDTPLPGSAEAAPQMDISAATDAGYASGHSTRPHSRSTTGTGAGGMSRWQPPAEWLSPPSSPRPFH